MLNFIDNFGVDQFKRTTGFMRDFTAPLFGTLGTLIGIVTESICLGILTVLCLLFFHVQPLSLLKNFVSFKQFQSFVFLIDNFV